MRHLPARPLPLVLGLLSVVPCPQPSSACRSGEVRYFIQDCPAPGALAVADPSPSRVTRPGSNWTVLDSQGPEVVTPALIFDSESRRALLIGGGGSGYSNGVWSMPLDHGAPWSLLATRGTPPSPRRSLVAIDDPMRHRAVVYGGFDGGFLGGLWQLSLGPEPTWSPLEAEGEGPPPLAGSAAVYDSKRDRMLLIHGNDGVPPAFRSGGVWALELSGRPRWRTLSPLGVGPAPRSAHSAIYDRRRDWVIMFGGSTPEFSDELWGLSLEDGGRWARLPTKGPRPGAREEHCAVYDPGTDEMIVYGGASMETDYGNATSADRPHNDAWALSLNRLSWRRLADGPDRMGRWGHRAIFDPVTRRMIVAGGWGSSGSTVALAIGSAKTSPVASRPAKPAVELPLKLAVRAVNPARGALSLRLELPSSEGARVEVFDIAGRRRETKSLDDLGPGFHHLRWDATSRLAPGIYFLRLSRGTETARAKVILIR